MSSSNSTNGEGSTAISAAPSRHASPTTNPNSQLRDAEVNDDDESTLELCGANRKRKRQRRGHPSCEQASNNEKPRRERANFTAAQLDALERLFHDQKYPDCEFRAKIANRLQLNEDRVQIWFQNRRAKYKRLQRENDVSFNEASTAADPSSYAPGGSGSIDYIPPQLDLDMLGPGTGSCLMQGYPAASNVNNPSAHGTNSPATSAGDVPNRPDSVPTTPLSATAAAGAFSRDLSLENGLRPLRHDHQNPVKWPLSNEQGIHNGRPHPTEASTFQVTQHSQYSVEQFTTGSGRVNEFSTASSYQTRSAHCTEPSPAEPRLAAARADVAQQNDLHRDLGVHRGLGATSASGIMCPTIESSSTGGTVAAVTSPAGTDLHDNKQTCVDTIPQIHRNDGSCSLPVSLTTSTEKLSSKATFNNSGFRHQVTPKPHGDTPCPKDSKCITCREKPPPNQVCTALPLGERNELDEALYRCAVGSLLGLSCSNSLGHDNKNNNLPPPDKVGAAEPFIQDPAPDALSVSVEQPLGRGGSSIAKSPAVRPKSSRTPGEHSLSNQRRMATINRKQRQLEAGYLSSSSDEESSDSGGEMQRAKRRRKTASRSLCTVDNNAPPNRVCTAVPLMDRTLPLPCLTKNLDSFLTSGGMKPPLLGPQRYPSCTPSPLSLDCLSSPEPQSTHSEQPDYSSTSSSDLSDFELILPPPSERGETSFALTRGDHVRGRTGTNPTRDAFKGGQTAVAPIASNDPFSGTATPVSASYSYAPANSAYETNNFQGTHGASSSVPLNFIMQNNPAPLASPDNHHHQPMKNLAARRVPSSASDENRRNQTSEILTESRMVGEMCSSPVVSPWSDPGLVYPYANHVSPIPHSQLYTRQTSDTQNHAFNAHDVSNALSSSFQSSHQHQLLLLNGKDNNHPANGFAETNPVPNPVSNIHQPYYAPFDHKNTGQHSTNNYDLPIHQTTGREAAPYDQRRISAGEPFAAPRHGVSNLEPMRECQPRTMSLDRALLRTPSFAQTEPQQNGYNLGVDSHYYGPASNTQHHFTQSPPLPQNRGCSFSTEYFPRREQMIKYGEFTAAQQRPALRVDSPYTNGY